MNITKTINTATVTLATVEVKDGKAETRTSTIKLYSCDALSDARSPRLYARSTLKRLSYP